MFKLIRPNHNRLETNFILVWLSLIGASLSLSLAIANILVALGFIYLLSQHRALVRLQFKHHYIQYILAAAIIFQCIELIHDGWALSKACKVFITFTLTLILGNCLRDLKVIWLPYLFAGLVAGLIIGTILNQYLNPEYPLWATYSMTYANQAAGFAITVGLLSFITKKWWLIIPSLVAMTYYTYMTGERSAVLALAGAFFVLLFILHRYKLILALALSSIAALWLYSHDSIQNQYNQNVRFDIWQHGMLIAQKDNFLGRGEQQDFTQEELNLYQTYAKDQGKAYLGSLLNRVPDPTFKMSYHNQVVQLLVSYGIIGSLIFLILLLAPILLAWKAHALNHEQITYTILWTAFAVHCLFETSFDAHSAIILGLLAGLMQAFNSKSYELKSPPR